MAKNVKVGDRVTWSVYAIQFTGEVVKRYDENVFLSGCDVPLYEKGDLRVMVDEKFRNGPGYCGMASLVMESHCEVIK